jgi:hypothetical protein
MGAPLMVLLEESNQESRVIVVPNRDMGAVGFQHAPMTNETRADCKHFESNLKSR